MMEGKKTEGKNKMMEYILFKLLKLVMQKKLLGKFIMSEMFSLGYC
jgi:hypothetical protein